MTDCGKPKKTAFHNPWKSLPRFPHSHRPGYCYYWSRKSIPKGAFLSPCSQASPGSFFDWKRLFRANFLIARERRKFRSAGDDVSSYIDSKKLFVVVTVA